MKTNEQVLDLFTNIKKENCDWHKEIILNKTKFIEEVNKTLLKSDIISLKQKISSIIYIINFPKYDNIGLLNISSKGDTIILKKISLIEQLKQIQESFTLERAKYYLERLKKGITEIKTSRINDINLNRWKEYTDIITDSLWILDKRDTSGEHIGWYWGNFVPQIPHQLITRYTKKGEWVLDTFLGSGTTLIECTRLGRNGIGIELNSEVADSAKKIISREKNIYNIKTEILTSDSRYVNIKNTLNKNNINKIQLIIMHPPYHNIIKFSKNPNDLSNAKSINDFIRMFSEVIDNITPFLEKDRYLGVVIGDKYSGGEWIPLGFYLMDEILKRNFLLKSIIVKNFEETRGKRNQKDLWKYRALVGGFYIFKHEYILLFKKRDD